MNRRNFIALASGLLVPWQPERVYSFLPAWRLINRSFYENEFLTRKLKVFAAQEPDRLFVGGPGFNDYNRDGDRYFPGIPGSDFVHRNKLAIVHPSNVIDILKSADAYGVPRPRIS